MDGDFFTCVLVITATALVGH